MRQPKLQTIKQLNSKYTKSNNKKTLNCERDDTVRETTEAGIQPNI